MRATTLLSAVVVLLPAATFAQTIYRWVGADGQTHYTDDRASIPKGVRVENTEGAELDVVSVTADPAPVGSTVLVPDGFVRSKWRTFEVVSDLGAAQTTAMLERVAAPFTRWLEREYFKPLGSYELYLAKTPESFKGAFLTLNPGGKLIPNVLGYTFVAKRRCLVDTSAGEGTLTHELSHAALRAMVPRHDFMPTWVDEGLAQLHEAVLVDETGRLMMLDGVSFYAANFRRQANARQVLATAGPRTLKAWLTDEESTSGVWSSIMYWLQSKGLLRQLVKAMLERDATKDPDGELTLLRVVGLGQTAAGFERAWRASVLTMPPGTFPEAIRSRMQVAK